MGFRDGYLEEGMKSGKIPPDYEKLIKKLPKRRFVAREAGIITAKTSPIIAGVGAVSAAVAYGLSFLAEAERIPEDLVVIPGISDPIATATPEAGSRLTDFIASHPEIFAEITPERAIILAALVGVPLAIKYARRKAKEVGRQQGTEEIRGDLQKNLERVNITLDQYTEVLDQLPKPKDEQQ